MESSAFLILGLSTTIAVKLETALRRSMALTPDPLPHLGRVRRLLSKIHSVVFVVPDDSGLIGLEEDLVAMVQDLMGQTVELLHSVGQFYENCDAKRDVHQKTLADVDHLEEIGALISTELAGREIADLAFVARGQLKDIGNALTSALQRHQIWAVASHADTGLRRAGKALVAIESAISEYEGLALPEREWVELEVSLKIRRLYGRFRRAIAGLDSDASVECAGRLEGAAHRIATLRQLEIYPFLRIEDRVTIRSLQKRIVGQLQQGGEDVQAAMHLWQDTVSMAGLLARVNDRSELRQHDFQILRGLCFRLEASAGEPVLACAEMAEGLEVLEGLDDELDEVIEDPDSCSREGLWAILQRLLKRLKPAMAGFSEDPFQTESFSD